MKKIIFISTFLAALFLNTLICSAAPTAIDLGKITDGFSWSSEDFKLPTSKDNTYRLSFEVDSKAEVKLTINIKEDTKILFFNGKTWSGLSESGSWTETFTEGSYNLDIYGKAISLKTSSLTAKARVSKMLPIPTPIPGALLLLGSGIFGFFLVGRSKDLFWGLGSE